MPKQPKRPRGRPFIGRKKVTLRLQQNVVDALAQESRRSHRSKSDLAEEALAQFLKLKKPHREKNSSPIPNPEPAPEVDLEITD